MKIISRENLLSILAGFKQTLTSMMDSKIQDINIDTSALMDKATFVSESDETAVKKADEALIAKEVDGLDKAPIFSVYGIDQSGNKGFYPFPVTSGEGGNFTRTLLDVVANTPYTIPLADERKFYDLICQAYKFVEGADDVISLLKTFNNTEGYNFLYDEDSVTFDDGMQIKKEHSLKVTTNSDGLFESEVIKKSDYVLISEII